MNKILVPEFFRKFKCIGSACENTCCTGWSIMIDKDTYDKYKNIKKKELNELINSGIEINPNSKYDSQYGKIKFNHKKQCKFLDNNKLCTIHKELGEKFLCYTCNVYPRIYNKVCNSQELSLVMSCPEAARLALLNPNKMTFEYIEMKNDFTYYPDNTLSKNEDIFWIVRIFTIEIIQNRKFQFWKRLLILGLFFEDVKEFIKSNEKDKVLSAIESFKYLLDSESIDSLLNDFEVNSNYQLDLIKLLNDTQLKVNTVDPVLEECIKSLNEGLQIEGELTEKQYELYRSNYNNYYVKYMDKYEYILENYFTNYVFINLFPFQNDNRNSFDEYCIMVLNYGLIKTYLIGMSGYYKCIDDDIILKLIQSLERTYHHGDKVLEYVFEKLKEGNKMNMKNMSLLLKN